VRLIKKLLWKLSGRDFLILNPSWRWLGSSEEMRIIGRPASGLVADTLPVQYSYHLSASGCLNYFVFGRGSGNLEYHLFYSSGVEIAHWTSFAKLPHLLSIVVSQEGVVANGQIISGCGIDLSDPSGNDLTALISFTTPGQPVRTRRTHHRMRFPSADVAEEYFTGRHYTDYNQVEREPHYAHVLKVLASFEVLQGRLIDIGCATGGLVRKALQVGLDAHGIDCSAWAIAEATQHLGNRVKRVDMDHTSADALGQDYRFVTAIAVLEHLRDPKAALETMHDICAPGGIVYLVTLNNRSMLARTLDGEWAGRTDYNHFSDWIDWTWVRDTSLEVGFEIESLATKVFWSDRGLDPVWRVAANLFSAEPLTPLLADGYGDILEVVLRKPTGRSRAEGSEG